MNKRVLIIVISLLVLISLSFIVVGVSLWGSPAAQGVINSPTNGTVIWMSNDPNPPRPALDLTFVGFLFSAAGQGGGGNGTTNASWVLRSTTSGNNYTLARINDTVGINSINVTNITSFTNLPVLGINGGRPPSGIYNLTIYLTNGTYGVGGYSIGELVGTNAINFNTSNQGYNITVGGGFSTGIGGHNVEIRSSLDSPLMIGGGGLGPINISQNNLSRGMNISGIFTFIANISGKNMTTNVTWYATLISTSNGTNNGSASVPMILGTNSSLNGTYITVNTKGLLANGNYTITMNATNSTVPLGGGESHIQDIVTNVYIDNEAPAMSVSLSDSDDKLFTREEQTVTCRAVDPDIGLASNNMQLVKPNGDTIDKGDVPSFTFKDADTAASGTYKAKCIASDKVGNKAEVEKEFTVRVRSSSGTTEGGPSYDYTFEEKDTVVASGREGSTKTFTFDGIETHTLEFVTVTETSVTLRISSTPQEFTLSVGGSQDVDINDDGKVDVKVTLTIIDALRASVTLDKLAGAAMIGEAPTPGEEPGAPTTADRAPGAGIAPERAGSATAIIIIIVIVIVIVGGYLLWSKGKKGKGKKGHVKFTRAELKPR